MTIEATGNTGSSQRWDSLDSLRGVAAFLVVTFHCAQAAPDFAISANPLTLAAWGNIWTWLKYTPLRVFFSSGPPMVVLFFVLSGFVLSLPFLREGRRPGYTGFALKRICRIYLPFVAAILFSAFLYAIVQPKPMPSLSHWFNTVLWDQPLTVSYIGRNLAMTGLNPDMTLDLVMWSLVHELRISLVFPLLFLLTQRWPRLSLTSSILFSVVCTEIIAGREATTMLMSFVDTGRFLALFTAGILVASRVTELRLAAARVPGLIRGAFWLMAGILLMSPGPTVYRYYDFTWGIGAILLIVLTVTSARADRYLSGPMSVWLGRVSYSLYLVHLPILVAAVHLANGVLPLWVTMLGSILASLIGAELMYRSIEIPSMHLGRTLAAWLDRRRAARVQRAWVSLEGTRP